MEINYNKILSTLDNIIKCENEDVVDDLKMAIEIIKAYKQNNEKAAKTFHPIVRYEKNILIDAGTNNYAQIRANFRGLVEKYTKEELMIQLERIGVELKLHLHKHECLQAEKEAIEWAIENEKYIKYK